MTPEHAQKPRSQKRQRPATASTRLKPVEAEQLRLAAYAEGLSVSDYLRDLVRRELALS